MNFLCVAATSGFCGFFLCHSRLKTSITHHTSQSALLGYKGFNLGIEIDMSTNAFTIPEHPTALGWDGFNIARRDCRSQGCAATNMHTWYPDVCGAPTTTAPPQAAGSARRQRFAWPEEAMSPPPPLGLSPPSSRARRGVSFTGSARLQLVHEAVGTLLVIRGESCTI